MPTIRAPFNFVPLNDRVYFPKWANQISHDIPFSDGESGVIELTITAHSPIFVRNGHTKDDAKNNTEEYKSFNKVGNQYFIPATSVKGAIRNVLEIISLGKMKVDKNAMFAQREWDNETLYPMKREQARVSCGWLKREGDRYYIVDCEKPYRIGHNNITSVFSKYFSKDSKFDLNRETTLNEKKYDPKTAIFKYAVLSSNNATDLLKENSFTLDDEACNEYKDNRVKFSENGDIIGKLVLTGQPDQWTWPRPTRLTSNAGKYYEFVFPNSETRISLTELEYNHFKFIYQDSPDWTYFRNKIDGEGIPVFFRKHRVEGKEKIQDLGLAFLYKLPYERSPYDLLGDDHKRGNKDLAECIFGNTQNDSLKGRVQFSACFADNASLDKEIILTLNSPKASYYPLYIHQDGRNGIVTSYKTYNDGNLSGWKRYPVRKKIWGNKNQNEYNDKLDTIIHPLKADSRFTGKIYFHNLKKIELGALLSAITFHNNNDCFHQIGQGKPYGFGKVKIDIKLPKGLEERKIELMALFEDAICKDSGTWAGHESIVQLFTMAHDETTPEDIFKYMNMSMNRNENEFLTAKAHNEYLQLYSALINKRFVPETLTSVLKELQEKEEAEKERMEEEEKKRKEEEIIRLKAEKDRLREENKAKKVEQGLSFLCEKFDNGDFKVKDFKGAKNRIDAWLKKADERSLPQEQWDILLETLIRLYSSASNRDKRTWDDYQSSIWRTIISYIGEEEAKVWFDKIISK